MQEENCSYLHIGATTTTTTATTTTTTTTTILLLLLLGILLVFDDFLLCASLTEYDNRHARFHCYLQHFLFTASVI